GEEVEGIAAAGRGGQRAEDTGRVAAQDADEGRGWLVMVGAVREADLARGVGVDQVLPQAVARRRRAVDGDAAGVIGHDVARAGRRAADRVIGRDDADTVAAVAQGGRSRRVGADEVALDGVATG